MKLARSGEFCNSRRDSTNALTSEERAAAIAAEAMAAKSGERPEVRDASE